MKQAIFPLNGKKRVVINNISPRTGCENYPVKAVVDERILITADIFCDGHDQISASVLLKHEADKSWKEYPMIEEANNRWSFQFIAEKTGSYQFRIIGWVNHFESWRQGRLKSMDFNDPTAIKSGVLLLETMAAKAKGKVANLLQDTIHSLHENNDPDFINILIDQPELLAAIRSIKPKDIITEYQDTIEIIVSRKKAGFSAWYELFPRSAGAVEGQHGTFNDLISLLPIIADMGFDTIYLPPIHPIGNTNRKGRNNSLEANPSDPGSPWAIGNELGGHKSIHPELGSLKDFKNLIKNAAKMGIEIAMDIALQCSPDHPYIKEKPEWFQFKPDGTIQYAENPPKKYEDIVPFHFECGDWQQLWEELKSIFLYWIAQGVHIFRVDNPHTKPFPFWEWLIKEIHAAHPEVILLSEAFTQPAKMDRLAMIGFSQSYTYFTWRHTKYELESYVKELIQSPKRHFFRPNFWPNTPDILTQPLAEGGENAAIIRLILAATLSSNYGIYGPCFELNHGAQAAGKEEYVDNEKYEIRSWDWNRETRTKRIIKLVNQIRKAHPALQTTWNTQFLETSNEQIIGFLKSDAERDDYLLLFINLDPHHTQSAHVHVPLTQLKIRSDSRFQVTDLLSGDHYQWTEGWNYVQLNPQEMPAHILQIDNLQNNAQ